MRIGILSRCLSHGAGVGRYARCLLEALAGVCPHELVLLSNKSIAGLAPAGRAICVNRRSFPAVLFWEQVEVPRIIRREAIDVFYNPDFTLPLHCPCPGVVTVHDVSYSLLHRHAGLRARLYYGAFVASSVRSAHTVLAVSETARQAIETHFGIQPGKVVVAYPAADARFHPHHDPSQVQAVRRKYRLDNDYVLYVGLLGGWKNVEGLLRAYRLVSQDRNADCDLVLAGRTCSSTPAILSAASSLKLGSRLHVIPDLDDRDLPLLYNGARLFAFPSLYEGFGLPPLEAMSCGVPVVCTNAGALPEVTGGAACLVQPNDTDAMAHAILTVLQDEALRKQMIGKGLRRAQDFSWSKTAMQVVKVFEKARTLQ